jgi:hypothetical protein
MDVFEVSVCYVLTMDWQCYLIEEINGESSSPAFESEWLWIRRASYIL